MHAENKEIRRAKYQLTCLKKDKTVSLESDDVHSII